MSRRQLLPASPSTESRRTAGVRSLQVLVGRRRRPLHDLLLWPGLLTGPQRVAVPDYLSPTGFRLTLEVRAQGQVHFQDVDQVHPDQAAQRRFDSLPQEIFNLLPHGGRVALGLLGPCTGHTVELVE